MPPEQFAFGKLMWAYEFILEEWVGVEADLQCPALVMTVHDEEVGLDRHFSLGVDPRFVSVRLVRDLEKPSSQDIARLLAEPTNIELWTEVLPPDAFEFDGMTVITAVDVTLARGDLATQERPHREGFDGVAREDRSAPTSAP